MARKFSDYFPEMKGSNALQLDVAVDLGDLLDVNGNEALEIDAVASAVNYVRLANAAASSGPTFSAQGDDTNIDFNLTPKGTGGVVLNTSGVTTTNALDINVAGVTTGKGIDLTGAVALTTGALVHLSHTTSVIADGGSMLRITSTGIDTGGATNGTLIDLSSTSQVAGSFVKFVGGAITTGVVLDISSTTGMTSGSLIRTTTSTAGAVATNGIISFRATGAYTSTSNAGLLDVAATATTAGTVVHITSTAAGQTTAQLLNITASGYTTGYTGNVVQITGCSTTGASNTLAVVGVNTTTGNTVNVDNNAITTGTSTIVNISHTTSVIGAGSSMLRITSTGIDTGTTTGTLLDLASTAAQAATLVKITSATLTSGKALVFTLAGLTTGAAIDTTGIAAATQNFNMNSSAGSTAAPQTNAPTGFFKIGIGGTDQWVPYYNAT